MQIFLSLPLFLISMDTALQHKAFSMAAAKDGGTYRFPFDRPERLDHLVNHVLFVCKDDHPRVSLGESAEQLKQFGIFIVVIHLSHPRLSGRARGSSRG